MANAAALDTYVNLAAGSHNTVVQAWDNTGAVYKSGLTVNVGGSTPAPPPTPVISGPYQNNLTATSNWIANNTIGPDGAILYGSSVVNPYYSNLAASGMVKDPNRYGQVQNWMKWYIRHLNTNDRWGLTGTTYDYNYSNGVATSTGNADSTDSYAATFLSLAWDYYRTGDANAQAYVKSIAYKLDLVGGVVIQTQQGDGLTWAWTAVSYVDPSNPATGETWAYQHNRYPWGMVQDTNKPHPVGTGINWIGTVDRGGSDPYRHSSCSRSMGSPHPGGQPCLFGDGSVRGVSYTINNVVNSWFWYIDDGLSISDSAVQ